MTKLSSQISALIFTVLLAFSDAKRVNTDFLNLISTSTSIQATDDAIKAVL